MKLQKIDKGAWKVVPGKGWEREVGGKWEFQRRNPNASDIKPQLDYVKKTVERTNAFAKFAELNKKLKDQRNK
jgi:hypothetical protein